MKRLITILFIIPLTVLGQINDNWDAVKVGSSDMKKIYVGNTLVWQKLPYYVDNGGLASSTGSTMNVSYPSGVSVGDGLILIFKIYAGDINAGSPPPAPSGWTIIGFYQDIGYDFYAAVYYRVPSSPLSGTVSLTNTYSSTINQNGIIYRYSNVNGADATLASVGMYYGYSFSITPTPGIDELGIITTVNFTSGEVSTSGDFVEDSKIVDSGTSVTTVALSKIGDGTQKTASYSVASFINFVMSGFSFY